ncbi:uncharacterized protein UTRI_10516_B [Ustilago trichophora]|uniref:Uncharacterized protein n=1 Tax=Ustilago trichophora TaxID=86804 RepID=A0A5C3E8N5_9BASI|nr:uncharacterized protein UTRI_10516_B [Ustilago trichophora]
MARRLLVAGSNSGCQLGVGHDDDAPTFHEALCRIDGQDRATSFPPAGYTVVEISSGANHTLAMLQPVGDGRCTTGASTQSEIWVAGTGTQGQLGPAHVLPTSKPMDVFTRLDLQACLENVAGLPLSSLSEASLEPKLIACGWNCSYLVLTPRSGARTSASDQDVLISLGLHRDNTFGELGSTTNTSADGAASCVHMTSFAGVLVEAGLDASTPFRIADVAAGLRHAVVALSVDVGSDGQARAIVAGWGSARQGQVGRIPEAASRRPGLSKRPGPAAAIVLEPQLIFDWKTRAKCKVKAGRDHTVVLIQGQKGDLEDALHCIGSNKQGQLLDASVLPAHKLAEEGIADVTCNWTGTHLLTRQQGILSCGNNSRGQLGTGSIQTDGPLSLVDLTTVLQQHQVSTSTDDASLRSSLLTSKVTVQKLVSGSEHSLLLAGRHTTTPSSEDSHRLPTSTQVWGWGWNEHGNLAQGEHDEADRDRPVLLLDGTRYGAAQPKYTPLDIWAGCGTTFILVDKPNTT